MYGATVKWYKMTTMCWATLRLYYVVCCVGPMSAGTTYVLGHCEVVQNDNDVLGHIELPLLGVLGHSEIVQFGVLCWATMSRYFLVCWAAMS